ncbi:hypothetical protein D3C87_1493860 [compost metagenome]
MAALLHGHAQGRQCIERIGLWIEFAVWGDSHRRGGNRRGKRCVIRQLGSIHDRCRSRCRRSYDGLSRQQQRRIKRRINRRGIDHRGLHGIGRIVAGCRVVGLRRFVGGQGFAAIGNLGLRGGRFVVDDVLLAGAVRSLVTYRFDGAVSRCGRLVLGLPGIHLSEAGSLVPGLSGQRRGIGGRNRCLGRRDGLKKIIGGNGHLTVSAALGS